MQHSRFLLLIFILSSCGVAHEACENMPKMACNAIVGPSYGEEIDSLKNESEAYNKRLTKAEKIIKLNTARIEALENHRLVTDNALASLTQSINDVVVPQLKDIDDRLEGIDNSIDNLNGADELFDLKFETIEAQIAIINTDLVDLQTTMEYNDLYMPIYGCQHSYFVLYDAYGDIKELYLTEGDGTIDGAWVLKNKKNYNLLIDDNVVCNDVKLDKNKKQLQYNAGNGLQIIDLSY